MATIIGQVGGWALDKINDVMANEIVSQISTSHLNSLWILPLVLRKLNGKPGMIKDDSLDSKADDYNKATYKSNPQGNNGDIIYEYTNPIRDVVRKYRSDIPEGTGDYPETEIQTIRNKNANRNKSRIIGPSKIRALAGIPDNEQDALFKTFKPKSNEIVIMNVSTTPYTCLTLQNRPPEIDVDPQSTWVEVKSMGRNVPFMMYTGASDTLSFDISWYSNPTKGKTYDRSDVITKCRLLESWSKSNGYKAAPPLLKIQWGGSNIFDNYYFILFSAKYTLSNFQDSCVNDNKSGFTFNDDGTVSGFQPPENNQYADLKLLPNMAVQHLVFKRVSQENIDYNMIAYANKLSGIPGIYTQEPSK